MVPSDHDIIMALGEDLPVGIWIARAPHGELVYANRTFAQIMGMAALATAGVGEYATPYGIHTRSGQPYPEAQLPFTRALAEQRTVVVDDITIHRADGVRVDVRATGQPVGDPITHVIVAFFDITREVDAERARAESELQLHHTQRLEAIGNLTGGIAHDFNNLIFGIKLIASELRSSERDPKRHAALTLIDDITERSATLTRSLLGFARRGKHRAMPVALNDVVAAMSELLSRTLAGVELTFELDASSRGTVIGDQSQLEQVIMNLVLNARDAVRGTGRVVVRTRDGVMAGASDPSVLLEVADDGHGISFELRDRVFEPYFTTKTQGPQPGTGLGLATVFGIAASHGGTVAVDDGLDGRGTTLRMALPAAESAAPTADRAVQTSLPVGSGTLLIVDDDPLVCELLGRTIELLGYTPLLAAGGVEAVKLLEAHRSSVRGVLLDMMMPLMGGRATYEALRAIEPAIRVLLMSGYTLNEEVQQILDLGVHGFLSKPYSIETLASAIAQLVAE